MTRFEIRQQVKTLVYECPEGVSLTTLHNKMYRILTRLQLRTLLGALFTNKDISRERLINRGKRETMYFPFNGNEPTRRKRRVIKEEEGKLLSMKDFMPGKKYRAYLDF